MYELVELKGNDVFTNSKGEWFVLIGQDCDMARSITRTPKNALVNTPPETVPLDRTNGAAKPLKWCMVTAAMVH